jgi:hypothetical protein
MQVKFISENLGSFLSLISIFQGEAPSLIERRTVLSVQVTNILAKDFIEPEQLAYLCFIIGASPASDKLEIEVENWFALLPLNKTKGKFKISEVVVCTLSLRDSDVPKGSHQRQFSHKPTSLLFPRASSGLESPRPRIFENYGRTPAHSYKGGFDVRKSGCDD